MTPSTDSGGQRAQTFCGFCGYTDTQQFVFCPRCGRPVAATSGPVNLNEQTRPSAMLPPTQPSAPLPTGMSETFGDAQTQPGSHPFASGNQMPGGMTPAGAPPAGWYGAPGWQNTPSGAFGASPQGGQYAAGPVSGQVTTSPPPKRLWTRGRRLGVLSGALLAFLLVGTAAAYFVYTAFFGYSPTDSARYLPATTLFYSSFDLQQVSQNSNSHNVTQQDVSGTTNTTGFEQETGLDFQKDVVPWIKRSFSFSLVDISSHPSPDGFGAQSVYGTVFLISTHDVNASNATIQKIITTQKQKYGVTFKSITYEGTTLQSDVDSVQSQQNESPFAANGPAPLVMGIVKDQVIIASTVDVAEQVVDRANGHGTTLADAGTFTAAMAKLPSGRFGTLYLNVSQLLTDLHITSSGTDQTGVNSYPVGYGSIEFTSVGMRLTFTLEAKAGTQSKYQVNGNTNASAGVVPDNTLLFAGLGNLSGFYQELRDASGGAVTDEGFTKTLGLGPDDPLFNAPVSVALLSPQADSNDVVDPLVMLHSSLDAATISAKVQQAVQTLGYKSSSTTLSGVTVTKVQPSNSSTASAVYYTVLGHDLVFGYDTDGISQAIATFQGKNASLAGSSAFKQLIGQAPAANALTLFFSLDNLSKAPGSLGDEYRQLAKQNATLAKVTATYLTYRSDGSGITITEDIALK
ncbi:MAG TPA: DUF3352 domain-containing protein [Ktedonobacterales bacterium]|nr:DUF3352 domain-containing protein [Ktedonobacterales bacterium]